MTDTAMDAKMWHIVITHRKRVVRTWNDHGVRKRGFSPRERAAYAYLMGVVEYDTRCEHCQHTVIKTELHHIDKNHVNNEFTNLIFLCVPCHRQAHRTNVFQGDIMSNGVKIVKVVKPFAKRIKSDADKIAYVTQVRDEAMKHNITLQLACMKVGKRWGFTRPSSWENAYYKNHKDVPASAEFVAWMNNRPVGTHSAPTQNRGASPTRKPRVTTGSLTKLDVAHRIAMVYGMDRMLDLFA